MRKWDRSRSLLPSLAVVAIATTSAQAPKVAAAELEEIIVSARKRDETSIAVPVVISAIGAKELERRGINTIDAVARAVPAVMIGDSGSGFQGGNVTIRGLGGADTNAFGDQAVSFAIDGVQVAKGNIRRIGQMDMQQIEVMKGPQALFFGKNSPAGVISIRTADPTPSFEAGISAGYEFYAREVVTNGYISGPLTKTLGARVAFQYSDMDGWLKRYQPPAASNVFGALGDRALDKREITGRVTLKYEPSELFDAKLKVNYQDQGGDSSQAAVEAVSCPLGVPQGMPANTPGVCHAGNISATGDFGPNFNKVDGLFPADGRMYLKTHTLLAGLEMNYQLTDHLKLTSVTGHFQNYSRTAGNFNDNYLELGLTPAFNPTNPAQSPMQILASNSWLQIRETTEEVRVTSDYAGRFNFMFGALYQDSASKFRVSTWRNALTPIFVNAYRFEQEGTAFSAFGQVRIDVLPKLELSAGGRYSHENKKLPLAQNDLPVAGRSTGLKELFGPFYSRDRTFKNFSPEVTLSYRPTDDMTFFASYKEGFLSGGYNASQTNQVNALTGVATPDGSTGFASGYSPQKTVGYEAGVKAYWMNRSLRTNLSFYTYRTSGLQVAVTTGGTQVELKNAGSVRTKGGEFDFNWRAPVEGLSFNGAVAYNKGYYLDYQASCYRGEGSALCHLQVNRLTGQVALLQDITGFPLSRAPKITANIGMNYDIPIGANLILGLSAAGLHSDKYFADTVDSPGGLHPSYNMVDAGLRLASTDERWEIAVIGKNLNNKFTYTRTTDIPFTGTQPGCAPLVATSPAACGGPTSFAVTNRTLGDTAAFVDRARQVMLRATYRFGK